jgi:predicted house-cleaning NTP pyrophosphatase (Maf/HAM1 superfamily)
MVLKLHLPIPIYNMVNLILGSSSQFRKQVFQSWFPSTQISTLSPDIDEKSIRHENAEKLVIAIANAKAGLLSNRLDFSSKQ